MRWIFELEEIKERGLDFSWEGPGESLIQEGDNLRFQGLLNLNFHLERDKEQVIVEGNLNTVLSLTCCRCLKNYPFTVKEKVFAIFIPQKTKSLEEEQELGAEELDINYYQGDSLDLTEILRDQLLLSVPMTPHCQENCSGLCPTCGQDWNLGSCDCSKAGKNSPFEMLKKLKL